MKRFVKKMKAGEGFTLIEMLIVVAIIAILVAISIPVVNKALEKARHATDAGNERSAKATLMIAHLNEQNVADAAIVSGTAYVYDAATGTLLGAGETPTVNYGQHKGHTYLTVAIDTDTSEVTVAWAAGEGLCGATSVEHP